MLLQSKKANGRMVASTLFSIFVILTFFIFFKDANAAFNARSIPGDKLSLAINNLGKLAVV